MRRRVGGAGTLILLVVAGPACRGSHESTPPIHVAPAAASRWSRWLAHGSDLSADSGAAPARVRVMQAGQALGGPNAIGRPGDMILENGEVVFVVDQPGSSPGFAESGGNLVDAADAHVRKDELGQLFTYFGTFPRQGVYDGVSSGSDDDGAAWVLATGHELYEAALAVSTRYTLRPGDRGLLIETTIENRGASEIALPSLGDAIQWGGAEKFAPGKAPGFKGDSSGAFVGGLGRFTSYAIAAADGDISATSGAGWTDTRQLRETRLPPGGHADYARVFLVGERADTSSIAAALAMAAGQPVGRIEAHLAPGEALPTGAVLTLVPPGSTDGLTLATPYAGRVPAGRYAVRAPGGTAGTEAAPTIDVTPAAVASVAPVVEPPATLDLSCVDTAGGRRIPCKLTFEGQGGTATPDFGAAHAAGPARHQVTTADGAARVSVVAGRYRITASRGPEYALAFVERDLAPGERRAESFALARVVDTAGYLGCDFHQHTMYSADAPVSARDRVIANVAEGVEVAVASEHNVIADLESVVRGLGLERELVEVSGIELTSDASRRPWGHANVFPLRADATRPNGGAPRVRDRAPGELFASLRAAGEHAGLGAQVVQINHPRSGKNGYFDLLGFDRDRGVGTDAAYDGDFDALEVWNGRNVEARGALIDDLRALLRAGRPVTPTSNTDTHGVVGQEAGYPRTYVRVADDAHLDTWDVARTADLVHGIKDLRDVVLTNGPMLRVTANGSPIGGVASARGGEVMLRVHVESAPWVDVDRVKLVHVRGAPSPEERPVHLAPLRSGAVGADLTLVIHVAGDDAVFVVASGSRPMIPVLAPSSSPQTSPPPPRGTAASQSAGGRQLAGEGQPAGGGPPADQPGAASQPARGGPPPDRPLGASQPAGGGPPADQPGDDGAAPADPVTLPWAMTGALWIDADGDGRSLSR